MKAHLLIGLILGAGVAGSWLCGGWLFFVVGLVAAIALTADAVIRPTSQLFGRVRFRGNSATQVAITFDDGPDSEITPEILKVLDSHNAKATFFVIGHEAEAQAELVRSVHAAGHELANHSYDHDRYLNFKSKKAHKQQIERTQDILTSLASAPRWYRPPMGLKSPPLLDALAETSLELVTWSIRAGDTRSDEHQVRRRLRKVSGGDIIVFHDGHDLKSHKRKVSLQVLPWFLELLQQRGLQAVTVSELLERSTE